MATNPEALAQLSRLLGESLPHAASPGDVQAAAEKRFERLVDGILAEVAASDDVADRMSADEFVDARLSDFSGWLSEAQLARLRYAVHGKIEAW